MFSISMSVSTSAIIAPPARASIPDGTDPTLVGLTVLCVDNDPEILAGMRVLLARWQVDTLLAITVDAAQAQMVNAPDLLLVDHHLHDRLDGLATLELPRQSAPDCPGALLTADGSDELKHAARERGYRVLTKPVRPASLRAFLLAYL